jgi:hypothetical protein
MTGKPRKHLLRAIRRYDYFGRSAEGYPLAGVRAQRVGLSASPRSFASLALVLGVVPSGRACSHEAEPLEDAAGLVSGEIGSVEARRAGEDLLGREAAAPHNHVMLSHRIGQPTGYAALDLAALELDVLAGDLEMWHVSKCIL